MVLEGGPPFEAEPTVGAVVAADRQMGPPYVLHEGPAALELSTADVATQRPVVCRRIDGAQDFVDGRQALCGLLLKYIIHYYWCEVTDSVATL